MGSATVHWIGGMNFVGVDSGNHSVVLSAEKKAVGVKPSEMLLVALASCSAVDVVEILTKKRKPLQSMEVRISSEHDPEPPWTFRRIQVSYRLSGHDLTPKAVEQAISLSQEKYCSVAATVRGEAEITWDYEIVTPESG